MRKDHTQSQIEGYTGGANTQNANDILDELQYVKNVSTIFNNVTKTYVIDKLYF